MAENILSIDTVALDEERKALKIIDQTLLPGELKLLYLTTQEEIFQAIRLLKVRGAPAIGVAAAIGVYLAALEINADTYEEFYKHFKKAKDFLASSRPTAVNLFWALGRMEKTVLNNPGARPAKLRELLRDEAMRIRDEDIQACKAIGEYGLELIKDGDCILTHCNAGRLATVRYGTALAPIHLGRERGMNFKVLCDETRPLLQGARLSAFEMAAAGVDTTLICDNMASSVMKNNKVTACFVGCDRVAANGDTANKIGTSGLAIIAAHYGIPFYVCAPASTIDMTIKDQREIVIEERDAREVTDMWYKERMAPSGIKVYNPAFDVTDNKLITAFITEFGIVRPPYTENFKAMFKSEGYVKYAAEHTMSPAIETPRFEELNRARTKLREMGLVGSASNGIGFGNLSIRIKGNEFLISGTATGSSPALGPDGYCLITSFDVNKNRVVSTGPVKPSSETMTHGVIYQSCPNANCVIHIHSRAIFDGMIRDKRPATPETAAYGTPEIALAIGKLVNGSGKNEGQIVLAGHDEGVIVYAPAIEKALSLTEELYNKYSG